MSDKYYCYLCGADSTDLAEMTDPKEMEKFDENHLEAHRPLVYEDRCPWCGFPYEDEDEDDYGW